MEKILAIIMIVLMAIAVSCAFPAPLCNTDADCDGNLTCVASSSDTKRCAYCSCLMADQCVLPINGEGNDNRNPKANDNAQNTGNGNANPKANANENANSNGNGQSNVNEPPIATCDCGNNTVQPICEPTCAYSPSPCGENTVCYDDGGTAAANCSCQTGYEGDPEQGCFAICDLDCDPNASCVNNNTVTDCECNDGYFGYGYCCTAIDECGGVLTGEEGSFSFPSTPETEYCSNLDCSWTLTTVPVKVLRLSFTRFEVEPWGSTACWDTLRIRDGPSQSDSLLNPNDECGLYIPPDVISTGHQISFRLTTDSCCNELGFAFNWSSEMP